MLENIIPCRMVHTGGQVVGLQQLSAFQRQSHKNPTRKSPHDTTTTLLSQRPYTLLYVMLRTPSAWRCVNDARRSVRECHSVRHSIDPSSLDTVARCLFIDDTIDAGFLVFIQVEASSPLTIGCHMMCTLADTNVSSSYWHSVTWIAQMTHLTSPLPLTSSISIDILYITVHPNKLLLHCLLSTYNFNQFSSRTAI